MSRVYINNDLAEKIKDMFINTPLNDCSRNNCWGITDWTDKNFGVRFDGGTPSYFLEGPGEKITWFILKYS